MPTSESEGTPKTRKALDRMEAHRKFHAAESGQLQPRFRNLDKISNGHKHSVSESTTTEHEPTRAVSWPITSGEVLVDFSAHQQIQTKTSPHVVPFRACIEMQTACKGVTKTPPSAWTDRTQDLLEGKLDSRPQSKRITIGNVRANKDIQDKCKDIKKSDTNHKQETISLLGTKTCHDSTGFELPPSVPLKASEPSNNSYCARYSSHGSLEETSKPKKLQKKDRPRSRNRRGSSTETVRRVKV